MLGNVPSRVQGGVIFFVFILHPLASKLSPLSSSKTLADLPITFASEDETSTAVQITPSSCGLDCTAYIANAAYQTWPATNLLLCWAHIARKFKDKKMKIKLNSNTKVIEANVHALHHTVARAQFFFLWEFISAYWTTIGESEFATIFGKSYVGKRPGPATWRSAWYVTAAFKGGVTVVSNAIESYNKSAKAMIGADKLHASVSAFFSETLKLLMMCV